MFYGGTIKIKYNCSGSLVKKFFEVLTFRSFYWTRAQIVIKDVTISDILFRILNTNNTTIIRNMLYQPLLCHFLLFVSKPAWKTIYGTTYINIQRIALRSDPPTRLSKIFTSEFHTVFQRNAVKFFQWSAKYIFLSTTDFSHAFVCLESAAPVCEQYDVF